MKILLTGSTGYIGRRLLPVLLQQGHELVCLVRDPQRLDFNIKDYPDQIQLVTADLLEPDSLQALPQDIDAVYFLVHSMKSTEGDFETLEERAARNFVDYLNQSSAQQIIYLSGIVNSEELSDHLSSRLRVEEILAESKVPLTVLRAAIIIGSGSASFEIIRDLVEKLPLMVAPKWVQTRCQPIGIANVLDYLTGVLGKTETYAETYDIGGPDILTYREIMLAYAKVRGLKRWIVNVPFLSPKTSGYWLYFVTSTSFQLATHLVDSMRNEVISSDNRIQEVVQTDLLSFEESVQRAFLKVQQNGVISSWTDAMSNSDLNRQFLANIEVPVFGCFIDKRSQVFERSVEDVKDNIWSIGGKRGWYAFNWLWDLRGFLDKIVGGVGTRRGRRNEKEIYPGDALDFWRVILADRDEGRLLLYAEMKLPGEAWLEFKISEEDGEPKVIQTATFRPWGIAGRLYWYAVLPFHAFIFKSMLNNLIHYGEQSVAVSKESI
ncbi:MAG: SDR family oxidoreductase [Bacteroidia bacterium]